MTCTPDTLSAMLEAAGIDHEPPEESAIYVTGLAFPFWLRPGREDEGLVLLTHWPLAPGVDELEALRFVNALNCGKLMVQFSLPDPGGVLWGHYWLSCRHGVQSPALLRSLHRFAGCFAEAVREGRVLDLLPVRVEAQGMSVH